MNSRPGCLKCPVSNFGGFYSFYRVCMFRKVLCWSTGPVVAVWLSPLSADPSLNGQKKMPWLSSPHSPEVTRNPAEEFNLNKEREREGDWKQRIFKFTVWRQVSHKPRSRISPRSATHRNWLLCKTGEHNSQIQLHNLSGPQNGNVRPERERGAVVCVSLVLSLNALESRVLEEGNGV